MQVYINGTSYEVIDDSIDINLTVEERSTASFTIRDKSSSLVFQKGEPVEIKDGNELLFGGVIEKFFKFPITVKGGFYFTVSCVDYHYFADKRIVADAFMDKMSGDVVRDVYDKYLKPEGIELAEVAAGDYVDEAIFNYIDAASVITKLARYVDNYIWYIDNKKRFYYIERGSLKAPWKVTPKDVRVNNANFEESSAMYRNKQYVKGAVDLTTEQTEIRIGDGHNRVFLTRYKLHSKPRVYVSLDGGEWVEQTVGINGVDRDMQFYWNRGSAEITQDSRAPGAENEREEGEEAPPEIPPLESNDRVMIVYIGQFETIYVTHLPAEIARMSRVDGSTGIVEAIEETSNIVDREGSLRHANSLLNKFGEVSKKINFITSRSGLEVGQTATVTLPLYELEDEEMLIESITISSEAQRPLYKVTAVKGPLHGSWEAMFNNIARLGEDQVERENLKETEQVVIPFEFEKQWAETEEPNIFKRTSNMDTMVGFYAGMTYTDRVKYMSWYRDGVERGRVAATQVTDGAVDTLHTMFHLQPNQANGHIDEFVWWGGASATEELGTGFIIDRQPFNREKINIELYQVTRYDYRWND
ncbi:hypothetical protein [Alkalihalobacterium chitinilyticum]|uniref:Prophage tail endopeptidase domain-containing protein n=1 Tax=Alkalihalobacterium chitinilyticum TaxID=2980103 RepID=A0ABT5VJ82_9BACI|nr:hypothetical protein [Alkalihalobacterium chitinilyticum]MDE5415479.1 hypothetical protein [Alkalihalobacterium chitinilyticum]